VKKRKTGVVFSGDIMDGNIIVPPKGKTFRKAKKFFDMSDGMEDYPLPFWSDDEQAKWERKIKRLEKKVAG
jgi:hypothetical protein